MIKRLLVISSFAMSSLTAGLHVTSHAYIKAEKYVIGVVTSKFENTVTGFAKDYGFVKPTPTPTPMPEKDARSLVKLYCTDLKKVPFSLAWSVTKHESNLDQFAESSAGAIGLMQLMPANAKACGLKNPNELFDEETNIKCGCQFLAEAYGNHVYTTRNGKKVVDTFKVLQEYNAGIHRMGMSAENRDYPYLVLAELE